MLTFARMLPAALALAIAVFAAPTAWADEDPIVHTTAATAVSATAATLNGVIPRDGATSYRFEYGIDGFNEATPTRPVDTSQADTRVSAVVTGLAPATVYHFRLVALSDGETDVGDERSFTTGPTTPPGEAPSVGHPIPSPGAPAPLPVVRPVLGKTMVVAPVAGTVKVRVPGQRGFAALTPGASVPVGAIVDTRAGTVQLTSAVDRGRAQVAAFHGGLFEVRQAASEGGMTDLVLRGGDFSACPRRGVAALGRAAALSGRRRPVRRLWGEDKGGRFRTHGRNSVAAVRGTRWLTTDTCAGTRTTVTDGAVAVRDRRRHKTVIVRAGHSYLARAR